jgi:hypothetical protein
MATRDPQHPRHFIGGLFSLFAASLACGLASEPARAAGARDLAGWWLAIDNTFPELWQRGTVAPTEELLIINRDGRVEDRLINFWSGTPENCAKTRVCSDAPLVATARLAIKGQQLSFARKRSAKGPFVAGRGNSAVTKATVTATPRWTLALEGNGQRMVLTDGKAKTKTTTTTTRTFARITPKNLQRLRAGMLAAALPADKHWRCYLANATARDPAFAPIRDKNNTTPDFLARYLDAASYLATLNSMLARPTPDDPAARKFIGNETEELLIEEFKDLRLPVTLADKKKLIAQRDSIMQRVQDARPNEAPGARLAAAPVSVALNKAAIDALARARSDDPAAKALFCRE